MWMEYLFSFCSFRAYEGGPEIDQYLEDSRTILKALADAVVPMLRNAGVYVASPSGAFYLFLDFNRHASALKQKFGITTSEQLCQQLMQDVGVACVGGTPFGMPRNHLSLRAALVHFDGGAALEELNKKRAKSPNKTAYDLVDDTFLRENCVNVLEATEKIVEWAVKLKLTH